MAEETRRAVAAVVEVTRGIIEAIGADVIGEGPQLMTLEGAGMRSENARRLLGTLVSSGVLVRAPGFGLRVSPAILAARASKVPA